MELSLEIVLRVPHPSNVLQGEDIENFNVSTPNNIIVTSCVAFDIVDHVSVVYVACVVDVAYIFI